MKSFSIFVYASNKKLEINYFSFSLKKVKGEKVKNKTRPKTDFWPTADRRESLKTPNRLIKRLTESSKTL
jgi:hypothetical protein